jgi:hypothetical protein
MRLAKHANDLQSLPGDRPVMTVHRSRRVSEAWREGLVRSIWAFLASRDHPGKAPTVPPQLPATSTACFKSSNRLGSRTRNSGPLPTSALKPSPPIELCSGNIVQPPRSLSLERSSRLTYPREDFKNSERSGDAKLKGWRLFPS